MLNRPDAGSVSYTSAIDNVRRYGSYQHLAEFPLMTLVAQSEWEIQASYRAQLIWNAIILLGIMIVVVVMGSRIVKANGLLNAQAMQDGLTGLANRRVFDETIKLEFRRAAWSRSPISVVLLDIDHFKDYNDLMATLPVTNACEPSPARSRVASGGKAILSPDTAARRLSLYFQGSTRRMPAS